MSVRTTRLISVAATTAVVAASFGLGGSPLTAAAATASTTFTCSGIAGDNAGSIGGATKSSADLLNLLASLGSSPTLSLPVTVESNAPTSVSTGLGSYDVEFDYQISLPDSLITQVKNLLKVDSIKVTDASFAVAVTGSANDTLVASIPQIDVSLATSPVTISQKVTGKLTPSGAGLIYYRPGAARLSIVVNGSVAGQANIGTLTVECTAAGLIGTTAVRPPGSPNITKNPVSLTAAAGQSVSVNLNDGSLIVPDQGNPILWDTLSIINQPSAGTATVSNGTLTYTAPNANGTYDVSYAVCGANRVIEGAPGVNEVQTIAFADEFYAQPKPLSFRLKFNGELTDRIVTSYLFGNPKAWWDHSDDIFHGLLGEFRPPTAAQMQAALEGLESVEPGDITVTGGPGGNYNLTAQPYTVTFANKFGETDVEQIEIVEWNTWLPNDGLAQILEAAKGLTGGGDAGPEPITAEQAWNNVLYNGWTFDQFIAAAGERLVFDIIKGIDIQAVLNFVTSLFPKTPLVATTTAGENAIAPSDSGPLCSQGVVQVTVSGAAQVAGVTATNTSSASGAQRSAARKVSYAG